MIDFVDNEISDELLAAYIDGKTSLMENTIVENSIRLDSQLCEVVDIASDSVSFGNSFDWELHKGDYGFWELGLPPAITNAECDIMANDSQNNLTSSYHDTLIFDTERESLDIFDDSFVSDNHSIEENNNDFGSSEYNDSDDFDSDY